MLAFDLARGYEVTADDGIARLGQVLYPAAANHLDRLLLEVMPLARYVGRHLEPIGQPHASDLPQRRVRLLGRRGVDAGADAALLRVAAQRGRLLLLLHVPAAEPDELIEIGRASCRERV